MAKANSKLRDLFEQLDAFYAQVPKVECKGRCAIACSSIPLTVLEARRLQMATHRKPRTTADMKCVYLTADERCSVYSIRPLICRAWGVLKTLSCIHGCTPATWFAEADFVRLAQEIERIAGELLITHPDGVAPSGQDFAHYGTQLRDMSKDADRTRNLRALHGGRIMIALENPEIK